MTTLVSTGRATAAPATSAPGRPSSRWCWPAASVVVVAVAATRLATADGWVVAAVVAAWAASAAVLAVRRPRQPLAVLVANIACLAAVALAAGDPAPGLRACLLGLGVAAVFNLAVFLPDGRSSRPRLALAGGGYVAGALCGGVLAAAAPDVPMEPLVVTSVLLGAVALAAVRAHLPARDGAWPRPLAVARLGGARDRGGGVGGLRPVPTHRLARRTWPWSSSSPRPPSRSPSCSTSVERSLDVVGRVLVHTIVITGMLGAGDGRLRARRRRLPRPAGGRRAGRARPVDGRGRDRRACSTLPARRRLEEFANRRVYGERQAPDEPLRTFAHRMSRAVPMDELLLQLAESLRKTMALDVGRGLDRDRRRARTRRRRCPTAGAAARRSATRSSRSLARAQVSGNAWLQVWLPALLAAARSASCASPRSPTSASCSASSSPTRRAPDAAFDEEEDRVLTDLARQLGLALHNVRLDTALQATLDELQVRNEELRASRARIVAAADECRRADRTQPARRRPAAPRRAGREARPGPPAARGRPATSTRAARRAARPTSRRR